jgi:hypothetical protein
MITPMIARTMRAEVKAIERLPAALAGQLQH